MASAFIYLFVYLYISLFMYLFIYGIYGIYMEFKITS